MNFLLYFLIFILGSIIGSFLNVVIYRFGTHTIHKGRSMCMSCGEKIQYRDLVPLFSFLLLGGRCRSCRAKISPQYILVEAFTGLLTLLTFQHFVPISSEAIFVSSASLLSFFWVAAIVMPLLVIIFVYDLKHKIIPDQFSFSFAIAALVSQFVLAGSISPSLSTLLAGPLLALPCAIIFYVSRGTWMGLGDAKLFLGVGWLLGLSYGISAFVLSFWIGAAVSLMGMYILPKKLGLKSEVPFAPFIIVATLIVYFAHIDVLDVSSLLAIYFR